MHSKSQFSVLYKLVIILHHSEQRKARSLINFAGQFNRPVSRAVTRSSLQREVQGLTQDTALPTARHRCDISSKGAVLPARNDAEMGPRKFFTRFDVMQRVY